MKVLVIGDGITDHYLFGSINRQSPEDSSIPVVDIEREEYRLGGCLNVAANIKSLAPDFEVHVSAIIFEILRDTLKSCGVIRKACYLLPDPYFTLTKTRVVNLGNNKQVVRLDTGKTFDSNIIEEYMILFNCISFYEYDCIIVSDYMKGTITEKVIKKLENVKLPIFVDTKNPNLKIWDNMYDCILKINQDEKERAITWPKKCKVIMTKGAEGAVILGSTKTIYTDCPTSPVENPEVTGCGDVFMAGLVCNYMLTKSLIDAILFANKAGRINATKIGTAQVSIEEVNES